MNRKEKEEYLVKKCSENRFREDTPAFREGVSKLSDLILDTKIETLDMLLKEEN